jgi:hypothetical protein
MAKKSMALARPQSVIVMAPGKRRGGAIRRGASRAKHGLKKAGGALAKGVWEEKLAVSALGGAALVGYLEGAGNLDSIPDPLGIGRIPMLAGVLYLAGRYTNSARVRQAGIGLAAAAAFSFAHEKGVKNRK